MPRLQRRTTFLLATFIAVAQVCGAVGFVMYQMSALTSATSGANGVLAPDPSSASYSIAWLYVFLMAIPAAALLTVFAAKGTRLLCGVILLALIPLAPFATLFAISP